MFVLFNHDYISTLALWYRKKDIISLRVIAIEIDIILAGFDTYCLYPILSWEPSPVAEGVKEGHLKKKKIMSLRFLCLCGTKKYFIWVDRKKLKPFNIC